ncbi:(2Fe-2S) ferredoxin domain-containing protein [Marivibrio halodurans]|uniref:(2Fe-2S) ferredoxin domain-containing protein n=1 Tax=Marivibrio halodurans TaxID=2039722 RepID=A0A8J7RZL8_9PROT|nr:(2Fe-2S) ferredoxin domain-containing protein [Marivibrio halodurans]MBP5857627.1 (2Fe-2S) ferredoxin domain-containing protein [Marivibrio halodurans]
MTDRPESSRGDRDTPPTSRQGKGQEENASSEAGFSTLRLCINFRAGDFLPSCGARGAKRLHEALGEEMARALPDMTLKPVHCLGRCHLGPTLRLSPRGPFLLGAQAEDVPFIVDRLAAGDIAALQAAFPDPEAGGR